MLDRLVKGEAIKQLREASIRIYVTRKSRSASRFHLTGRYFSRDAQYPGTGSICPFWVFSMLKQSGDIPFGLFSCFCSP
jgi:hypothetical protein